MAERDASTTNGNVLMRCPFCNHVETNVKDSRPADEDREIRRRRECPECNKRFTTREKVEFRAITALKASGGREPFDPEKLTRSMQVALRKRPIKIEVIEDVANRIVREIESSGDSEITTQQIGHMVLTELFDMDEVGAVRYASVYRDFKSLHDYTEFLQTLERNRTARRTAKRAANQG
jgi:transcriptional repressor NrdR